MLHRLLNKHDIAAGPIVLLGGAPCQDDLYQRGQALGLDLRRCYAATECGGTVAGEDPTRPASGTVGHLLPGVQVKIADDGELLLAGVLADPTAWWPSGDRAQVEADGSLSIVGRCDEQIISGGLNLNPKQIAEELCRHHNIDQAVVDWPARQRMG